jgi:hypothetical protein
MWENLSLEENLVHLALSPPTETSGPAPAQVAGTPAGTVMTLEYAATLARFAYVWGWPLVNNLNRSIGVKDLPGPGRVGGVIPASPPGHVSMLTDYISAEEHYVTCPNQDTVYGRAISAPILSLSSSRYLTSAIAFIRIKSRTLARTLLARSGSSMGPSQAFTHWSDRTGRARSLRASLAFSIRRRTLLRSSHGSFRMTRPKTRQPFSLFSTRSWSTLFRSSTAR